MLDQRLHLLLDKERYQKLQKLATHEGVSVAAIIREAIDNIPSVEELETRRAALEAILAAAPMPVPDGPEDLKREIDEMHDRVPGWS